MSQDFDGPFRGKIGRTREQSTPWRQEQPRAPSGAPNIVIVYMDDMGFSDLGCYGSEIRTPNIDAVAARGLRFSNYTTHPICSPARAALLTGMNAHAVGSGFVTDVDPGFPGYSGRIPLNAATLAETVRESGYETIMTGKWHNTPAADCAPGGSKKTWPTQRGFDTFYGFLGAESNYFFPPNLMLNNRLLPVDQYAPDYYSTDDWTNKGIQFIRELRASAPRKPFLLFVANNAVHAPLQAKRADIGKHEGRYAAGWTEARERRYRRQLELGIIPANTALAPTDPAVPAWEATHPDLRPLLSRHMEVYAGMVDCIDQNVGKLVAALRELGELDNTIFVISSDNGATESGGLHGVFNNTRRYNDLPPDPISRELEQFGKLGGPYSAALYPTGWGQVSNTPFPLYKTFTGAGGRRVSFIISWPKGGVDGGGIRHQFVHVSDVMPTLLDLAGVNRLETIGGSPALPLHGASFKEVLLDAQAASIRKEQYYECWANRGYYREGWFARSTQKRGEPIDLDNWTLHNLEDDFSESAEVQGTHPEKLSELVAAFDQAAWANQVYPLDNRSWRQKLADSLEADVPAGVTRRYLPGMETVSYLDILPLVGNRSFRLGVRFTFQRGDTGILWSIGNDPLGGMVMYVEGDLLHFRYNGFGAVVATAPVQLQPGKHEAALEYEAGGSREGRGRLALNGLDAAGWMRMSPALPTLSFGIFEGLDIGLDRRGPVCPDLYERYGAFPYSGTVEEVILQPGAKPIS